jgi:flagellum-specific peptidoglycan hydrolase FlgJ
MSKYNKFSEEKLIAEIKSMHFKFPYIVLAQAMHETNFFVSPIFNENHNLFGMKESYKRINVAKGTQSEHAYYNSWNESVIDYALYTATYLSVLKTEEDYFDYLSENYAEDKQYVFKLKTLIKEKNLKSYFN